MSLGGLRHSGVPISHCHPSVPLSPFAPTTSGAVPGPGSLTTLPPPQPKAPSGSEFN